MVTAHDIMNPDVISVRPEEKVEDVLKILTERNISGVPVINGEGCVIGIVTERDLLVYSRNLGVFPLDFAPFVLPRTSFPETVSYENKAHIYLNTKVEEVMSRKVITAKETDTWREVASLMTKKTINRIPVVNDQGKLIGIITRNDLLNFFAEKDD